MARAPRVAAATAAVTAPATVTSPAAATAVAAPPPAPTPDALPDVPVRRPYRVLARLKWGGERHGVGTTVAMTEAEAETLVTTGVLADV